ncbi:MAG: hypothetical protein H7839_01055 [Magnetococcus sp. YQC-5]
MNKHPAKKRFIISMGLGSAFGLLCVHLAAHHQPELASPTHPIFWAILTDRLLIGMTVAFAGVFTTHPILGFAYRPWLRGACLGAMVSLPLASGALNGPAPANTPLWFIFAATLFSGAIYGLIIDIIATRSGGEGASLLG